MEALQQIHSCFFSHSINERGSPLSAATVSLYYRPRCLRSAVTCGKTSTTVTCSEPMKVFAVFCYAVKTNNRTIRSHVSQPASAGKVADMSELQAHHCMTPEQWTWLLCCVNVIPANELSLQELHQLTGIKLLTFGFLKMYGFNLNFQDGGRSPFSTPADAHVTRPYARGDKRRRRIRNFKRLWQTRGVKNKVQLRPILCRVIRRFLFP